MTPNSNRVAFAIAKQLSATIKNGEKKLAGIYLRFSEECLGIKTKLELG
jgi:hypothetical protein